MHSIIQAENLTRLARLYESRTPELSPPPPSGASVNKLSEAPESMERRRARLSQSEFAVSHQLATVPRCQGKPNQTLGITYFEFPMINRIFSPRLHDSTHPHLTGTNGDPKLRLRVNSRRVAPRVLAISLLRTVHFSGSSR